ncbi:MAG: hypothetical protein K5657_09565 [Desulfovibrio sp.]|nr:hypothetical protein [Desulfovibrio sp.]
MSQIGPTIARSSQYTTVNTTQIAAREEHNIPRELQNARVSNTQQASLGFNIRSFFTSLGRFFGLVRAAEPPQPRVPGNQRSGNVPTNNQVAAHEPTEQQKVESLLREKSNGYAKLPQFVKDAGKQVIDEFREMFGKNVIPDTLKFTDISDFDLPRKLARCSAEEWKGKLKDLIREDINAEVRKRAAIEVAASFAKEHGLKLDESDIKNFASKVRDDSNVRKGLKDCNDLESLRNLMKEQMEKKLPNLRLQSKANTCMEHGRETAAKLLADKMALNVGNILDSANFAPLESKMDEFKKEIKWGQFDNKTELDVEQAFKTAIEDFVEGHVKLAEETDGLNDVSDELKMRMKSEFMSGSLKKGFKPMKILSVVKESGAGQYLKEQLDAGKKGQELVDAISEAVNRIKTQLVKQFPPDFLRELGIEDFAPFYDIASQVMFGMTPGLAEALHGQDGLETLVEKSETYTKMVYISASNIVSGGVKNSNEFLAEKIEKDGNKVLTLPLHLNQAVYDGVKDLRTAYGNDALPSDMRAVLDMEITSGKTVRQALAGRVRNLNTHLKKEDLVRFVKDLLTPKLRERAVNQVLNDAVTRLRNKGRDDIQLSDLDRNRIINQLPRIAEAKSLDDVRKIFQNFSIDSVIVKRNELQSKWDDFRTSKSSQLAKGYGLTESRVQKGLSKQNALYDEFMSLKAEMWADLMDPEKFSKWCTNRFDARMDAIRDALSAIGKAELPDAVQNTLIDKVLSGKVETLDLLLILDVARQGATHIKADKLIAALNNKKFKSNDVINGLKDFEMQMGKYLPSKGVDKNDLDMMRDMMRQIFMEQHKDLAMSMARIPADTILELSSQHKPASDLSLLHVGRGIIADDWLQPNEADDISSGRATGELQKKLENALQNGEKILQQIQLPEHLHPLMRRFIGGLDLSTDSKRTGALATATRMAASMQHWKDFSYDQCPKALADYLTYWQNKIANDYVGKDNQMKDNINKNIGVDVPRNLYSIGGKGYLNQSRDNFVAEFKDTLTPNHAQPDLSVEMKARHAKIHRFVSSLMGQTNLGPLNFLSMQQNSEILKQDGVSKFVTRPWGKFKLPILNDGTPMHVGMEMSKDGKTAVVRHSMTYRLTGMEDKTFFGSVRINYEMTVNLEGDPKVISSRVSQKLSSSIRGIS